MIDTPIWRTLLGLVLLLTLMHGTNAHAQTAATLVGDVTDPTGATIPSATVTVTNTATGVTRTVTTSEGGAFRVFPLNPGGYDVSVTSEGFKTRVQRGIVLEVASQLKVDFTLEIGNVSESVEVTGAAPILQTQDASVGSTVNSTELTRIPVNGRNYTRLILLLPGTSDQYRRQSRGTSSGTNLYSVNGARAQDNNYSVDGVDNNFMLMNSPGASPPMDSIQEFRVATNNDAQYGRSMGANVNMAIRSGTNQLHGSAYDYFRNDNLDANDFFANRQGQGKVPFVQNQYGVSAGGPFRLPGYDGRDKTFWFFSWEAFRRRRGSTLISTVPTAEQRAGDFSTQSNNIYNPFTSRTGEDGSIIRDPFPNNQIPQSQLHPSIQTFLDLMVPLPNLPGLVQNYVNTSPISADRDTFVGRFDHHQGENDFFSFRILWQDAGSKSPYANPYISSQDRFDSRNYMGSWNHIFSPTSVLEVRFGYNDITSNLCDANSRTTRANFLDATGMRMFERDVLCDPIVGISAVGEFSVGAGGESAADDVYQTVVSYSLVRGNHSFKLGGDLSRRHHSPHTANPPNADVSFTADLTSLASDPSSGHSTATMLLGTPRDIRRGFGSTRGDARVNALQVYAQDDWRITPKLTMTMGLRYEANNPPYDTRDQLGNLQFVRDASTGAYTARLMWAGVNPEPDPDTGLVNEPPHQFGFGRALMRGDYNNFAPRLGLAYQVNEKTVVRSGFGIFYNSTFMQEYGDLRVFWPYVPQQDFTANVDTVTPNLLIDSEGPSFSSTAEIGGWPQEPNNRSPYASQWNLFVQRQLFSDMSIDIGYVGSASKKQAGYTAINTAITPGPGPIQPRRLAPNFGNVDGGANRFSASYNALQIAANKRFSKGIQFRANYTWSKSLDEQSSLADWKAQDAFNIRNDWSRSTVDVRHVFQVAYVIDLPFGRGRKFGNSWSPAMNAALGGWSIEGYTRMQTGSPFNFLSGRDVANVGRSYQRPDVTCNPNTGPKTPERWFDTSCLAFPAQFTYGNAGAFIGEVDGRHSWDLSMIKHFYFLERHEVQFRGEFFNLANTVKMNPPTSTLTSSSFGRVSSGTDARQIQLVLRYQF